MARSVRRRPREKFSQPSNPVVSAIHARNISLAGLTDIPKELWTFRVPYDGVIGDPSIFYKPEREVGPNEVRIFYTVEETNEVGGSRPVQPGGNQWGGVLIRVPAFSRVNVLAFASPDRDLDFKHLFEIAFTFVRNGS